ncbi:MAG: ATP-dependent DNA helicase RecG [Clostridia bacterium]|nr:ATP-dependent DNA helicase RecG [Clostridia bacterium]
MLNALSEIRYLKGVGEKRAEILRSLGIDTVGALLRYYPRGYEDFSKITRIRDCNYGEKVCLKAKIITPVSEHYIRKNMTVFKFDIYDGTGYATVSIFNNKYLAERLHEGSFYLFLGKITGTLARPGLSSPLIRDVNDTGIEPIYPASSKITSTAIRKLIKTAVDSASAGDDPLPERLKERYRLCDLDYAIANIHFPKSNAAFEEAKKRLVFEELFILQTGLMLLKGKRKTPTKTVIKNDCRKEFYGLLPYTLTSAQLSAVDDCLKDMSSGYAMNRLIEGDVGSGKTAVAAALMYVSAKNGFQSALMAPTEVLATQHYETVSKMLEGTGITVALLTGSVTKKQKSILKEKILEGAYDIVIGTHAVLTGDTLFNNLGLVITDEQHRFGVAQRANLSGKGENPHTVVMSATPIPRTLGLIIYGDLDISVINEYPKGRQVIETYLVESSLHERVYKYIKKHLDEGRQGYIVCPLVEENEDGSVVSAEEYFNSLSTGEFSDYKLGLLHGKMKPKDKEKVMKDFSDGLIDLLISTTVIEVGIDVPNAAIMVIENAEKFGLSGLHQLRGRIGRGKYKSTCILISDSKSPHTKERLSVIVKNRDGFKIADKDLELRGPGDFLGNRQHGLPDLKIADLFADRDTLKLCGMAAADILEHDPKLKLPDHANLRNEIINLYKRLYEN